MDIKDYPDIQDLRALIRFSEKDGTIWLAENRMVLMHNASLAALRKELIDSVGRDHARRVLTRMGFASGVRDAELAKRVRAGRSLEDGFFVGPQLHMLEGVARVVPVALEIDVPAGHFYGEFLWESSWEAEAQVADYGNDPEPACWMHIGHASGYASAFMDRFILFREVECAASGANHCRIVGKPVEAWDDAAEYTPYFEADSLLNRLLELRHQVDYLRSSIVQQTLTPHMVGASRAFRQAYDLVQKAAASNVSVLLLGETGVGKERFARTLHALSARKNGPFVAINCAALPHDLIESELFGAEKGAYTGAQAARMGKFERADGGTLFLDEIGELPLAAQAKLLRVLQEGEIERLGDDRTRKINVRLVTATNVNLHEAVGQGRFRADLYYRLNVYPIHIPPLRERIADIPPLVEAMLERFYTLHEKRLLGVTDKAMQFLKAHPWPGNIRELENMLERGVILAPQGGWIEVEHLFSHIPLAGEQDAAVCSAGHLQVEDSPEAGELAERFFSSGLSLEQLEAMLLNESMRRAEGNMACAARRLGITRPQLAYRLKKEPGACVPLAPH